jgi:membrane protein
MALKDRIAALVDWVRALKPVRVFERYLQRRGPLLSSGLSFQAIFAVFGALWVTFAIAGAVIASQPELQRALFELIETSIPGLIDDGTGSGAIDVENLFSAGIFGWTGLIAAGVLLFTALGWLEAGRDAVRAMFGLGGIATNPILAKLKDLGLALAFAAALALSAALTVFATAFLGTVFDWLGVDQRGAVADAVVRGVVLLIVLGLDTVVLAFFYRGVSGIRIPLRQLAPGTILAAVALLVLKVLGTSLLGGASNNPLLASFAVIIGLLLWFNFVCQVILLGAAWIAVSVTDAEEASGTHTIEDVATSR